MEFSKADIKFNRNISVGVRVSPSENQFLNFYCKKVGLNKSTFLRMVGLREAKLFYNAFKKGHIIGVDEEHTGKGYGKPLSSEEMNDE